MHTGDEGLADRIIDVARSIGAFDGSLGGALELCALKCFGRSLHPAELERDLAQVQSGHVPLCAQSFLECM